MVLQLQIEDPTVNVEDIEKYKLAFMMQFFVQHKQRFRFPRLRLQDLYQQVITEPDPTALCDCVARILRFLRHSDPSVCISNVDESLDYFVAEKRTTYRIAVQNTRNGRLVGELDAPSRARLLENLIESVYDEQPDFTFASSAGFTSTAAPGRSGVKPEDAAKPGFSDQTNDSEDILPEDVNVLIKAGQDANGCSYYYMDDLRLYRESPQGGLSSHWSVAVGPTAYQWCTFISSLSQTEEEADLGSFLKQELFVLVQESFDAMELHACNTELQPRYLLSKEAGELTELRRRRGLPPALPAPAPSPSSEEKSPTTNAAATVASPAGGGEQHHFSPAHATAGSTTDGGGGGGGSSASTCPLTPTVPTACTPSSIASVSSISSCSSASAAPLSSLSFTPRPLPSTPSVAAEPPPAIVPSVHVKREPSTAPNTPGAPTPWTPEAQGLAVSKPYQHPNSVGPPCGGLINFDSNFPVSPAAPAAITTDAESSSPRKDIFGSPARPASAVQYHGSTPKILEEFIKSEPQSASICDGDLKGGSSIMSGGDLCPFNSPTSSSRLRSLGGPSSAGVMLSNSSGSANFPFGSSTPHTNGPRDSPNAAQLQHQATTDGGMTTPAGGGQPAVQHPRSAPPYTSRHQFAGSGGSVAVAACQSPSAAGAAQQQLPPPPRRPSPTMTSSTKGEHANAKSAAGQPPTSDPDASLKRSPSQQTTMAVPSAQQQQQPYMLRPGPHHHQPQQPQQHHNQYYYPSSGLPPPPYGAPHALIFTTQLANEAAAEFARSHTRIAVFHHQRTLAMGKLGLPAAAATIIPGPGSDAAALTQEQWENRKSKIAQLEKIHSTLSKSKSASTPGVATVALQQQQQHLYGGHPPPQMGAGGAPVMPVVNQGSPAMAGTGTPCQPRLTRPDTLEAQREWDRLCMDHLRKKDGVGIPPQVPTLQPPSLPQDPRQMGTGMFPQTLTGGVGTAPMRPVNPDAKSAPNQMIFSDGRSQFAPGGQQDMLDPSCSLGGGGMQMSGPPVLVVPPNNACGYPPSRYIDCSGGGAYPPGGGGPYQPYPGVPPLPPAAGHKRSYSSSLKSGPGVTGLPDHPAGAGGDQLPPYMGVEFGVNGMSCTPPEFWSPTMSAGGPCDPLGGGPVGQSVSPGFSSSGPLPTELLDPTGPGGPGFIPTPVSASLPVASAPTVGGSAASGGRSSRTVSKKRKSAAANRGGGGGGGGGGPSTTATTVINSSPMVTSGCGGTGGVVSSPARGPPYSMPGGPVQRVPPTNTKQQQQQQQQQQISDACGRLPHPTAGVTDHWPPPQPQQPPFNSGTHPQMIRAPLGSGHYPPPGMDPSGHQNPMSTNGMTNFRGGGGCHVDYSGIVGGGYLSPSGEALSAPGQQQAFPTSASSAVMPPTAAAASVPPSVPNASSSSTQHLTSTSLARLARLSQLTGSEGVFSTTTSTASVATTTTAAVPSSAALVNGPPISLPNSLPPPTTCTVGSNCGSMYNNRILPGNNGADPCHFMSVLPQADGDVYPISSCPPTTSYSGVLPTPQQVGDQKNQEAYGGGPIRLRGPPHTYWRTCCSSPAPPLPGLSPSLPAGAVMACRSSASDPTVFTSSASTSTASQPQQAPPHQCSVSQQSSQDRSSAGNPVSTAATGQPTPLHPTGAPVPPQAPPPSQQQHSQPPPSIQVNNTFFNAQLNVQQMNYQHVNGSGSSSQMQIHFVQQQQQQQNLRPPSTGGNGPVSQMPSGGNGGFYGNGPGGAGLPASFCQASSQQQQQHPMMGKPMEARSALGPTVAASGGGGGNQGNANVQITPKTPHTIQYLPAASSTFPPSGPPPSSNPGGYPGPGGPSGLMYGGQGPPSEQPYFGQGFHPGPPPPQHKLGPAAANLMMTTQQPSLQQSTTSKAPQRMMNKCGGMLPPGSMGGQMMPPGVGMYTEQGMSAAAAAAGMHGSAAAAAAAASLGAADGVMLQHAGGGGPMPPRMMRQRMPPAKSEQQSQQHQMGASSGGVPGGVVLGGGGPPPPPGAADISAECMYGFKPNSMFPGMAPEGCEFQVGGGNGPPMPVGSYVDHEMGASGGGGQPLPASAYHQRNAASYRDPTAAGFPSYTNAAAAAQRCTSMGGGGGGLQSCLEMSMSSSVSSAGFPGGGGMPPQSSAVGGKMMCQSSATLISDQQQQPHYMPGGPRWQPNSGGGPPPTAVSGGDFYGPPRADMCTNNNPQLSATGGGAGGMMMMMSSASAQHYYQHGGGGGGGSQTSNPGLPSAQSVRAYQTLM